MPASLSWDSPSLSWDSALTWDAAATTPTRKTMNNTKANIDFSDFSAAELSPIAHMIHDKLTLNAATFDAPPVTLVTLLALITTYGTKLTNRASRATSDGLAFNEAREALEVALGVLGNYVNGEAKGDAMLVDESGFPSYNTARTPDTSPPNAPADLRLRHGELPGSLLARYKPERAQSTNEVQANTGDPNNEADWQTKGIFKGGRAELDGFTPGTLVWVRVRSVGLKGVMGVWSDPAQIRVM